MYALANDFFGNSLLVFSHSISLHSSYPYRKGNIQHPIYTRKKKKKNITFEAKTIYFPTLYAPFIGTSKHVYEKRLKLYFLNLV